MSIGAGEVRSRAFLSRGWDGYYYAFDRTGPWFGPYVGEDPYVFEDQVRRDRGRPFLVDWVSMIPGRGVKDLSRRPLS